MRIILFGATGMIGQGVLREALLQPDVTAVLSIGRTPAGVRHEKFTELILPDLLHYTEVEPSLTGFDACLFCLGVSYSQVSPAEYERLTYTLTLAAAGTLARLNPSMTFIYVSGAGTDSSESGSSAWARIKGRTENALLRLPFRAAYMFRPAAIQPMHGEISKTRAYRLFYSIARPLLPFLHRRFPAYMTTTVELAQAMLNVARHGASKSILENADIQRYSAPDHPLPR